MIVRAIFFALAFFAVFAHPYIIELLHDRGDQVFIGSDYSCFKVSSVYAFCSHACPGEIGAACVGKFAVNDDRLEMHSWTQNPFHAFDKDGVSVEVFAKGWARFFGVYESYGDFFFGE